jgi:NADH-quinone oxidoreductase subunit C
VTDTATVVTRPATGSRALLLLKRELPGSVLGSEEAYGEVTIRLAREHLVEAVRLLRDHEEAVYDLPLFVTAVDWIDREPEAPRFDVVYQLRSMQHNDQVRLVVQVPEDDPRVPTLEDVFAGMDWHERECFDLCGITFEGHHDLRRLLLPEDWVGHPLRKDYVSFGEPVAFTHNIEWALTAQERPRDLPGTSR